MKKYLPLLVLAATACSSKTDEATTPTHPATRTIFIGTGEIMVDYDKDLRKPIRIMLDTLDTPYFDWVYSEDLAKELKYTPIVNGWTGAEHYQYYDLLPLPVIGSRFFFAGHQNKYGAVDGVVSNLARQRAITGQQIDLVIGQGGAAHLTDDPHLWDEIWAHLTDSEGRNLLEYHTDVQMEVPYDWGMGEE